MGGWLGREGKWVRGWFLRRMDEFWDGWMDGCVLGWMDLDPARIKKDEQSTQPLST